MRQPRAPHPRPKRMTLRELEWVVDRWQTLGGDFIEWVNHVINSKESVKLDFDPDTEAGRAKLLEELQAEFEPDPKDLRLGELALQLVELRTAEQAVQTCVDEAKAAGATWAEIAVVAGIKPQSAYQRWNEK